MTGAAEVVATVVAWQPDHVEVLLDDGTRRRWALDVPCRGRALRRGQRVRFVVDQDVVVGARLSRAPLVVHHP